MVYKLGRLLQLIGLLTLPIAMAGEATEAMSLGRMLIWACIGIGVFLLGRELQQRGQGGI